MAEPASVWREAGEAIVLVLTGIGGALGWKARQKKAEKSDRPSELERWRSDVDEWRDETDNVLRDITTKQAVADGAFARVEADVKETKSHVLKILIRLGVDPE